MEDTSKGDIHYIRRDRELVLYLSGEITAPLAIALYEHLQPHANAEDIDHVHIDLSRVSYMDSTTVGTFIKIRKTFERHNGAMCLWNLSSDTRRILSGMHLLDYFEVDHDAALEKLREHVLQRISPSDKKFITDEYVLSAHQDIVEAEPALQSDFDPLITILKQRVRNRARGSSDE